MDISVNKPVKEFLKKKFQEWYSNKISKQLEVEDVEAAQLKLIDMCLPIMKELGASWLVEMADYVAKNPQFIVYGFVKSGICQVLDGKSDDTSDSDESTAGDDGFSDLDGLEIGSDR